MRDTYHAAKHTFKKVDFVMDGVARTANRMVDGLAGKVAHESKVGYMALTNRLREEALKDAALIKSGDIDGAIWHFYKSAVTGKIGPSKPLETFLKGLGIKVETHR